MAAREYLADKKDTIIQLISYITKKHDWEVSVLAVNSSGKRYSISKAGTNISDDSLLCSRGFVICVYDGRVNFEYSCSEIKENEFEKITQSLENMHKIICPQYKKTQSKSISHEPKEYLAEYKIDPAELGDEKIITKLETVREKTLAQSDRIKDCSIFCSYSHISKMFIKGDKNGITEDKLQHIMWMTSAVRVMAARGDEIKDYYKGYSNLGGAEVLEEMEQDISYNAETAVKLLESRQIVPGEYECICTPDVTGMIVHEAFGHGVEMDMFVKDRALAKEYIGKYVASPLVTMHDGAAAAKQTAAYFFDDEGIDAQDTVIIDRGILKQGISDLKSAGKLGTKPTGNGRRESYKRKAYTRMTNTFFEAGKDKLDDMIKSVKYGFLLENASSGMEDPKNWGIQCMVNIAREIRDGEFTGQIFSPIVLTGYVPDLLKSISMVSDKVEMSGTGYCGKGYKEWVKVSDGGPYIKAKIRLG